MMPLSRRSFLGAMAALPLALHQRLRGLSPFAPNGSAPRRCLLLDATERCVLQESLAGFACGLAAASIPFERVVSVETVRPAHLIVVPGAVCDSQALAETLHSLMDSGSTVLYESGAAYADHTAFEAEQRWLRNYFGVSVQAPQELWPPRAETGRPPYVRYHWPSRVMIRDFSRVIPAGGEAASSAYIAQIGETAVACHRAVGRGAFIFLGSPLGPHLGFGDPEAQRLLECFVSSVAL
jgi:hypothetical protein